MLIIAYEHIVEGEMPTAPDDLDAVRTVVTALEGFDSKDQERIIRWASEKLGLSLPVESSPPTGQELSAQMNRV